MSLLGRVRGPHVPKLPSLRNFQPSQRLWRPSKWNGPMSFRTFARPQQTIHFPTLFSRCYFSTNAAQKSVDMQDQVLRDMQSLANSLGIKKSIVPQRHQNNNSSSVSANENVLIIRTTPDGKHMKLPVPLPCGETLVVTLKPNETVHDLITDIRQEDATIDTLVFRYADNFEHRVAHTTTVADLLKSEFIIEINDKRYTVPVSSHISSEAPLVNALTTHDIRGLIHRAYFNKIRNRITKDPRHHITVQEFMQWCQDFGLNESESEDLLKALHFSGVVLHFAGNEHLSSYIFLNPTRVFQQITESLNLRYIKESDLPKLTELRSLRCALAPLTHLKDELDAAADRHAKRVIVAGFFFISAIFFGLAQCVWVFFNWDIVEPITYFVGLTTLIGGYSFFLATNTDYSYPAWRERLANKKRRKLYLANRFNWAKWNYLNERVKEIEAEFGEAQ